MVVIGDYEFCGPFSKAEALEDRPGVYVVMSMQDNDVREVLAVDIAEKSVREQLMENSEHDIWIQRCIGRLQVAVLYVEEPLSKERLSQIKASVERELYLEFGSSSL